MARVDRMKQKRDGTRAYQPDCQVFEGGIGTAPCEGAVKRVAKQAESFGIPFTTHAELCEFHAKQLGFK